MAGEETIAALLAIWDEGPASDHWAKLLPQLILLVDRFHQSADDTMRAELALQISDLLRHAAPELHTRFVLARRSLRAGQDSGLLGTRGVPPPAELSATWNTIRAQELATHGDSIVTGVAIGEDGQATEPRYTRYTDISCPRRVQAEERVTITVALTRRQRAESLVQQPLDVYAGKLKVRLTAPCFEPLSPLEQTIAIEPDDDSPPVVFHLKPRDLGRHEITIQFLQGGENPIATAVVPIEVLELPQVFEPAIVPPLVVNPWMEGVRPPDLTLMIFHDPSGRVDFTLSGDGVVLFSTQHKLSLEPRAFIDQVYKELGLLQRGQDSAGSGQSRQRRLNPDQVDRRIHDLGYRLWDSLIPADLKVFYGRERARWRVTSQNDRRWSLFVQSNEADIPWELVLPYAGGAEPWEEGFWCHTFYFARWLLKRPDVLECYAPLPQLRLGALAAIVPTCYPELEAAPAEHALLRDLIARHRLVDRSPEQATEPALVDLLEQGGYDWMHVVTHGNIFSESALHSSAIGLEDGQWLAASAITGPHIRGALHAQRPAFVLNACHLGREAPSISGAAGWATQLIGSGAAMLIAPLWSVVDEHASRFSQIFYEALLHPERPASVAEAVWRAREAIRQKDDPTWLAYSLFAHPNATITIKPQP
jgi:hypothetical protein